MGLEGTILLNQVNLIFPVLVSSPSSKEQNTYMVYKSLQKILILVIITKRMAVPILKKFLGVPKVASLSRSYFVLNSQLRVVFLFLTLSSTLQIQRTSYITMNSIKGCHLMSQCDNSLGFKKFYCALYW
jgi:hypothetical protein